MCGICGKLNYADDNPSELAQIVRMMNAIEHRGPDGSGQLVRGPVALGHRRLSIIDLSTGAQPIANEDNSAWIVFNGEIYNFEQLRPDLQARGHKFRTGSDTEVILHLYEEYGPECVQHLRGMFAFAIWDEKRQNLFLARDRVGIKPLYYCDTGKSFLFGSEIKSILTDSSVKREINYPAIDRFLSHYFLPGEDTLFNRIKKLDPSHYMVVDRRGGTTIRQYWDLPFGQQSDSATLDESAARLSEMLKESVRLHMISDVPVGFLLSGGVDSTSLLSYAVHETQKEIKTFTIGFDGENFADERPYARLAAQRFGAKHYEISMTAEQFRDFLPRYVWHMEEPVCEPPAIALYYVSKLARDHVKVLLSGEGGDEAFGGYPDYRNNLILERFKRSVGPLRHPASLGLRALGKFGGSPRCAKYAPLLTSRLKHYYLSRSASPYCWFNRRKASIYTPEFLNQVDNDWSTAITRACFDRMADKDLLTQMLYVDTKTWLVDDLLIKADKITMANSLELRVPLLDHKILEFAATLPSAYKVKALETKRVLKRSFEKQIPMEIIKRKKTGFPVPYSRWLQHELKSYTHDMLTSQKALNRGIFKKDAVEMMLGNTGKDAATSRELFACLVLELWHQQFVDSQTSVARAELRAA